MLYAIPLGLLAGWLRGGSLDGLARVRFRWGPVALAGLLGQVILFSTPLGAMAGDMVPVLYVATTLVVLIVVAANLGLPGMTLVLLGAISNLVAILANGGYMPADPAALAVAGLSPTDGPTNSVVLTNPAVPFLTDVFALPDWAPFANVFSVGDVLIAVGLALAIAAAMRRGPEEPPADDSSTARESRPATGPASPD